MKKRIWGLKWSDDLSVGIPGIDREHRDFMNLVDELNQAIVNREALQEIQGKLELLLDHARLHFAHEKELFRQSGYPDAEHHMREHAATLKEIGNLVSTLNDGSTMYEWIEVGLQLKEILIEHLLEEDMKYRDYYRSLKE